MTTLKTAKRSMDVKAKKLRREGFVPAIFVEEIWKNQCLLKFRYLMPRNSLRKYDRQPYCS